MFISRCQYAQLPLQEFGEMLINTVEKKIQTCDGSQICECLCVSGSASEAMEILVAKKRAFYEAGQSAKSMVIDTRN